MKRILLFSDMPIPSLISPENWGEVQIKECGEPLVPISTIDPERIVVNPVYFNAGIQSAPNECYARKTVADMLYKASKNLTKGWKILVFDAWRPYEVQQQLFDQYKDKLRIKFKDITHENLIEKATLFVSLPSTDPRAPSPHLTGGAIDLSLTNSSGKLLDMGTEYDSFRPESSTNYYEGLLKNDRHIKNTEKRYLENRRILFNAMHSVGFSNFPSEWWHFDYGNQFWATINNTHAIYGGISNPFMFPLPSESTMPTIPH